MAEDGKKEREILYSPTNSQQTVSDDDDEIDYSIKPEFYDSNLDDKDESWVQMQRKGRTSDAVLSCPACFTTLCLECQRESCSWLYSCLHILFSACEWADAKKIEATQPSLVFIFVCIAIFLLFFLPIVYGFTPHTKWHEKYVTQYRAIFVVNCKNGSGQARQITPKPKRGKRRRESTESDADPAVGETFKSVCCSVCSTEVGVIDEDEVYHFFNVLSSES